MYDKLQFVADLKNKSCWVNSKLKFAGQSMFRAFFLDQDPAENFA
jgi:hypothetical protein